MNEDKNTFKYNWPKFKDEKLIKSKDTESVPQPPPSFNKEIEVVVDPNRCLCCGLEKEKSFPAVNGSQTCPICKRISSEDQRVRHGGNKSFNN